MAVKVLRVEGLRDDTRSPAEQARLEAAEDQPLDLTVGHVLERARLQAGLSDFGPMEFTERLGLLLDEVAADGNLWMASKAAFAERCVRHAASRLMIQRYRDEHPGYAAIPIGRPINVVALSRSGSTHLENLLAADRRLRHLPVYLAAQPAPGPAEQAAPGEADPRWVRAQAHWENLRRSEIMAAMHEQSPDHACGENELQMPDFSGYQWEWLAQLPGWRDYYLSHDQRPHYQYMRDVLQVIAHQFPGGQRWMLKSNQHAEQLGPLLATYPDVTVVMIHRDPVATLQSLLTMRGLALKASQRQFDLAGHVDYWVDRVERFLRAYLRDRELVPEAQLVELPFSDVVADDVAAASQVLERAGLPATGESLADIRGYTAAHPRGSRVVYDLAGDFGLDADELRHRFAFYTDQLGIRPETGKDRGQ